MFRHQLTKKDFGGTTIGDNTMEASNNENRVLLNSKQLAAKLGVSERAVRDWIFKGRINSLTVRLGRLVRFDSVKVDERISNGGDFLDS